MIPSLGGTDMVYVAYSADQTKQRVIQNQIQHLQRWKKDCLQQGEDLWPIYNRLQDAFGVTICVQSPSPQRSRELIAALKQEVFRSVGCNVVAENSRLVCVRFGFENGIPRCAECDRRDNDFVAVRNRRWDYYTAGQLTPPVIQRFEVLEDAARNAIFDHRRRDHSSTDTFL
jgi:hypothetical protein